MKYFYRHFFLVRPCYRLVRRRISFNYICVIWNRDVNYGINRRWSDYYLTDSGRVAQPERDCCTSAIHTRWPRPIYRKLTGGAKCAIEIERRRRRRWTVCHHCQNRHGFRGLGQKAKGKKSPSFISEFAAVANCFQYYRSFCPANDTAYNTLCIYIYMTFFLRGYNLSRFRL